MQIEQQINWLNKKMFDTVNPIHMVIIDFTVNGRDKQLIVNIGKEIVKFSIWGNNLNELIKKFGNDTDKWVGKQINMLKQEGLNETVVYIVTAA